MKINSLIFDLDGVITSEENYWDADRLSLWELLTSDQYLGIRGFFEPPVSLPVGEQEDKYRILSPNTMVRLKNSAVNSNWDITYVVFSVCLASILRWLEGEKPEAVSRLLSRELDDEFIADLGKEIAGDGPSVYSTLELMDLFLVSARNMIGPQLLAYLGTFFELTTFLDRRVFQRDTPLWELCRDVFQGWVTGDTFKKQSSIFEDIPAIRQTLSELNALNLKDDNHFRMDLPVLPTERIKEVFRTMHLAGADFAVATGRPRKEAVSALNSIGILDYFDEKRIITQGEVDNAEAILKQRGRREKLSKPHPYPILKAIYPDKTPEELFNLDVPDHRHGVYAMIGDAMSDILSAKQAGCTAIGVLSGAGKDTGLEAEQREFFTRMGADKVISNIEELPELLKSDH